MRRKIKRILITLGVTTGVLAVTAADAAAAVTHSEPTPR